jgi:hypothetical protein
MKYEDTKTSSKQLSLSGPRLRRPQCFLFHHPQRQNQNTDPGFPCLMPDHLHLLVSPRGGANLSDVLGHYESYVTRIAWQHGVVGPLWERSFYDQIVRNEKAVSRVVAYILNNPVKAKLVEAEDDWPWSGTPDSLATRRGLSGDHGGSPRPRPYRLINQIHAAQRPSSRASWASRRNRGGPTPSYGLVRTRRPPQRS